MYKVLIRHVLTYASETWTLSKTNERLLSLFERKVLRCIFGAKQENGAWRNRYSYELYEMPVPVAARAARLLRLWVQIPPETRMFFCCECCVLSGRGLCDGLITRPEESYRLWRVIVCDQETAKTRRLKPAIGL
jgi:hypothetical protein